MKKTNKAQPIIYQNKLRLYEKHRRILDMLNEYSQRTGCDVPDTIREALDVFLTARPLPPLPYDDELKPEHKNLVLALVRTINSIHPEAVATKNLIQVALKNIAWITGVSV